MPKTPRRKQVGYREKVYAKDKLDGTTQRKIERLDVRIERAKATKAALEAQTGAALEKESEEEVVDEDASDAVKRYAVAFFWIVAGSPTDKEAWAGKGGTISFIRRRMGTTAPTVEAVRRTLLRLVDDPAADLSERTAGGQCGPGRGRKLEDWEDIFALYPR